MFEGFGLFTVETAQASIRVCHRGSGPPLLLLHGSPQTHVMWHLLTPRLAEDFTVIATDLRGYGDSSKPETTPDREPYSKRSMALDQVEVMKHFGFERFALCGHDRCGRVVYRMALDNPGVATKLAVLDIVPTWEAFSRAYMAFAQLSRRKEVHMKTQQAGTKRTDLQRHDLSVPGREVVQVRVDFDPGYISPKHKHPGEEIIYVLEGTLEYQVEGKPPTTVKAGEVLFIPAGAIHAAKNVGSGNGAELATYVVEKGKPLITLVE